MLTILMDLCVSISNFVLRLKPIRCRLGAENCQIFGQKTKLSVFTRSFLKTTKVIN